jgi:hypothetical protein
MEQFEFNYYLLHFFTLNYIILKPRFQTGYQCTDGILGIVKWKFSQPTTKNHIKL